MTIKFKVGDKVRFKASETEYRDKHCRGLAELTVAGFDKESDEAFAVVEFKEPGCKGAFASRLELISEEPKAGFKVGDRVRFTDALPKDWWFKSGQTGVIEKVNNAGGYEFNVRVDGKGLGRLAFVNAGHIEHIEHIETAFKVGDRVIVDDGTVIGRAAVIKSPRPELGSGWWLVRLEECHSHGYAWDGLPQGYGRYVHERDLRHANKMVAVDCRDIERRLMAHYLAAKAPKPAVQRPVAKTWIVAVLRDGEPAPNSRPYVHSSKEMAFTEARRLAEKHPGQTFVVFEAVGSASHTPARTTTAYL